MLKFKNKDGKIVMEQKDNGKLNILDEKLKESFDNKKTITEEGELDGKEE